MINKHVLHSIKLCKNESYETKYTIQYPSKTAIHTQQNVTVKAYNKKKNQNIIHICMPLFIRYSHYLVMLFQNFPESSEIQSLVVLQQN